MPTATKRRIPATFGGASRDSDPRARGGSDARAGRAAAGLTEVMDIRCRSAGAEDFIFLATMLGHAASRLRPPTGEQVLADPRYGIYLEGWPRLGDFGLIAEQDEPVGAAWYRIYTGASHGYGYVSDDVPELSIAVVSSRRHRGVGRRLLLDLIEASVAHGHQALSLSVNCENPARVLYESVGFVPVEKRGSSWTMVRHALSPS